MASAVFLGMDLRRDIALAATPAYQNVASRGQAHNGTVAASGAKTRMKGATRFVIGAGGAKSLQPVFANFFLTNAAAREVDGPAYTIRKAAISHEGVTVPLTFAGQRSVTVPAGAVDLRPDAVTPERFGTDLFHPGSAVFVRVVLDLPASPVPAQINPMYAAGESQLLYDPANEIDDIDGTAWGIPGGAEPWVAFPHPVMLIGEPAQPATSLVGIGDSILDGSVDNAGDGSAGGGWLRRAAFAANLPYLSISRTGDKAQFVAAASGKTRKLLRLAGAQAAIVALGNNDIRDGRSFAQLRDDLRNIWAMLRAEGIQFVAQAQVLAETASTDQSSSISGQTIVPAFAAGGVRSQINTLIASLDGGALSDQIDIASAVQSLGKWDVPAFQTTLAAAVSAWAGSVSLARAPEAGDFLVFEPATPANQDAVWPHVASVSGSGPYTATLTGGPTKAHAAGVAVRSSLSADGIHPQQAAHKRIALKAAPALQRAAAVKKPWIDASKSFEIDFVNRRAQRAGVLVPVESLVSCVRASAGKAFDGLSWSDFSANALRHADGGGLFVEPAATNAIRNNTMQGGAAPGTRPTNWNVNLPGGVTVAYAYGVESGVDFVDLRFTGTAAGGITIDPEQGIAATSGETWTTSFFLADVGAVRIGLNSVALGGRAGASGGSGSEFPTGADVLSQITRSMKRFQHTFLLANAATININPRLSANVSAGATIDFTLRLGLPQLEKRASASSPIATAGASATRAADAVTIALPAGTHNLTLTFDDGSTQAVAGISGNYTLPVNLNRAVVNAISGVRV